MGFVAKIFGGGAPKPAPAPVYVPPPAPVLAPSGGASGDADKIVRKRRTKTILTSARGATDLGETGGKTLLGQ